MATTPSKIGWLKGIPYRGVGRLSQVSRVCLEIKKSIVYTTCIMIFCRLLGTRLSRRMIKWDFGHFWSRIIKFISILSDWRVKSRLHTCLKKHAQSHFSGVGEKPVNSFAPTGFWGSPVPRAHTNPLPYDRTVWTGCGPAGRTGRIIWYFALLWARGRDHVTRF
jgi:hypothetical protein